MTDNIRITAFTVLSPEFSLEEVRDAEGARRLISALTAHLNEARALFTPAGYGHARFFFKCSDVFAADVWWVEMRLARSRDERGPQRLAVETTLQRVLLSALSEALARGALETSTVPLVHEKAAAKQNTSQ